MKLKCTIILVCLLKSLFAQQIDANKFPPTDQFGDSIIFCNTPRERIRDFESNGFTKEDSINCRLIVNFKTDSNDLFYIKEFNTSEQLKEEGYGYAKWDKRKFLFLKLKPKSFEIVKTGN